MEMDDKSLCDLRARLAETRKVFPSAIEKIYHLIRIAKLRLLKKNSIESDNLPDIPEELFQICNNFDKTEGGEEIPEELREQTRMILILAARKNCEISKIIDAI